MELAELRRIWKAENTDNREAVASLWNGMAAKFSRKAGLRFEDDAFLQLMDRRGLLRKEASVLDVGCGTGAYLLAAAPRIGRGVGCDIAEDMLAVGRAQARERGIGNAEFLCLDWRTADIDALGWRGAFDVVFAHMTPAVCDYDTLDKLVLCAKGYCLMKKPARRTDRVLDTGMDALGLPRRDLGSDETMQRIFCYLWNKGFEPAFHYAHRRSASRVRVEEAVAEVLRWARLQRETTPEDEETLRAHFSAMAKDGLVSGEMNTTTVTIDWAVSTI